jgi:hypothetical protein
MEVVFALEDLGRIPGLSNGWQQQRHKDGDNGHDSQQLHQCETASAAGFSDARHLALLSPRNFQPELGRYQYKQYRRKVYNR